MAKLSEEEQATLKALQEKAEAPDEPERNGPQRIENLNITIDLNDENQVKRAVRSGLLPKSYLEDDDDGDDDGGDDDDDDARSKRKPDDAPRRRLDGRYT